MEEWKDSFSGGQPVSPAEIGEALRRVWREAALADEASEAERRRRDGQSAEPAPRIRATLSNFILFGSGACSVHPAAFDALITQLCISYPSRFFVIVPNDAVVLGNSSLRAAVSSRCVKARSGVHVCSEEILLSVALKGQELLPSLLASNSAPDVPTIMFAVGDLACRESCGRRWCAVQQALASGSDLFITDSAQWRDFPASSEVIERLPFGEATGSARGAARPAVHDLAWYRGDRWRVLIAEQFDAAGSRDALDDLTRLTIRCSMPDKRVCAEALLLAGWILVSLGKGPGAEFTLQTAADGAEGPAATVGGLTVQFVPGAVSSSSPVEGIEFRSGDSGVVAFSCSPESELAEISAKGCFGSRGKIVCDFSTRRAAFAAEPLERLISRPLLANEESRCFRSALRAAKSLSAALL